MKNILITGGAGYIGSVLVEELLRREFNVAVVDNFMWGVPSLAHLCHDSKLDIIRGDCRDMRLMKKYLTHCDAFIPLAAFVGAPLCDADTFAAAGTNQHAIVAAVDFLASKEQRVLYPNTNSGYGTGKGDLHCDEHTPLNPISLYGKTKCAAESYVLSAHENSVVFRLATVFGMSPRMRLDLLVNDFTYRAVTDGSVMLFEGHFKRNYIHVRDVARAFIHAITVNIPRGAYNVGLSDANLSKLELCALIKEIIPRFIYTECLDQKDPDQRNYIVSNAKIEATGYRPCHSLRDGVVELVKGYRMLKRYGALGNV